MARRAALVKDLREKLEPLFPYIRQYLAAPLPDIRRLVRAGFMALIYGAGFERVTPCWHGPFLLVRGIST